MPLALFVLSMTLAAALAFLGGYFIGRMDKVEPVLRAILGRD